MEPSLLTRHISQLQKLLQVFQVKKTLSTDSYTFVVAGRPVGIIRKNTWEILSKHSDVFQLENKTIKLKSSDNADEITATLNKILGDLCNQGLFPALRKWRNEEYDIVERFGEIPVFRMERSTTYIFGLKRFGVHINGYTVSSDGKRYCWLQRRSKNKAEYPGKLDSMVGGGLESGTSVDVCLNKEAFEEASISNEQISKWCKPVGHVSFLYEDAKGINPETLFCYDALLPEDFQPTGNDGEVDEFVRVPFEDLLDIVLDKEKFKISSLPVLLDFLIRHHVLTHKFGSAYFDSVSLIHQDLHRDYPPRENL